MGSTTASSFALSLLQFTCWLYWYKRANTDAEGAAGKLATKRASVPQDGLWTPDATSKVSA
jgi:hypothetical protein